MNTSDHMRRINKLEAARDKILNQIIDEACKAFPVGQLITFHRGSSIVGGQILEIDLCRWPEAPKFKILSHTGNVYWVSFRLLSREFNRHGDIMFAGDEDVNC